MVENGDIRCDRRWLLGLRSSSAVSFSASSSLSLSSSESSSSSDLSPGAPKALSGFDLRPVIANEPGVAKDGAPVLIPPRLENPPPKEEPNVLPPNADLVALLRAPNPPPAAGAGAALPAKEDNLGPLIAEKGESEAGLASPPNGEVVEFAKLPKAEALNLSSEVTGRFSALSAAFET